MVTGRAALSAMCSARSLSLPARFPTTFRSVEITSMAGVSTVPPYPITKSRPAPVRQPHSLIAGGESGVRDPAQPARNWWVPQSVG
jgi:hypothetical protein